MPGQPWALINDQPRPQAIIRQNPEDFRVEELPAFEAEGEGEHVLLTVEKTGANTDWVGEELARFCALGRNAVSYAGRKDRHAVTVQRFSLHMPGRETPDFSLLECPGVRVLAVQRHDRKLRRGALAGNAFTIVLRDLAPGAIYSIEQQIERASTEGFANYFGAQRFGRDGRNWQQAERWLLHRAFKPRRNQREMLLSAARSAFFNAALSARIREGNWLALRAGDMLQLAGSHSIFQDDGSQDLSARIATGDISPALALPGEDSELTAFAGLEAEAQEQWRAALRQQRVDQAWRAIRIIPEGLRLVAGDNGSRVTLSFTLPPGCFATALLDELVDWRDASL